MASDPPRVSTAACDLLVVAAGIREGIDGPRAYLRHELGDRYDPARALRSCVRRWI